MDPNQPSFPTKGSGTARVAISFAYVYRTRRVQSQLLVVPTALSAAAQQKLLNDAWASLDLLGRQGRDPRGSDPPSSP